VSECQPSATITYACFSSKQLERDPSETAAELLVVLVSHFNGSGIPSRSELSLDHFAAPVGARLTNAFWFLSLSLALVVSMLAILAKQWITMFSSRMRAPVANFRRWAHRHRVFRDGIDRWHINAFVSSLSVALHGAVFMFMLGLNVQLYSRDLFIFGLVLGVTVLAASFYVAATVAPLFDGTCPTATPLLIHGRLVCYTLLNELRSLFLPTLRSLFSYSNRRYTHRYIAPWPPFDPEAVLMDGNEFQRDVRVLTSMLADLPSGRDVDTALDSFGGLRPGKHDLGDGLVHVRDKSRQRLEQFGSAVGLAASDPAGAARALRSSIFIESSRDRVHWEGLRTLVTSLRSIHTHDVAALSTALQLQQHVELVEPTLPHSSQLGTQIHRLEQLRIDRELYRRRRWWSEQFGQSFGIAEAAATTIARWKVQVPSTSYHRQPFLVHTHVCLFTGINHFISSLHANKPVDLAFCAALIIGFGGEPNLRKQCNALVTPLAISALDRECYLQPGRPVGSRWQPLPESMDWRLRAIDLWAHVTSDASYLKASAPLVGEVYPYILTQWLSENWWCPLPSVARLRRIVIPPDQLSLPTAARATLWKITSITLEEKPSSSQQLRIICDILQGVSPDEMIAAHPEIVSSIFSFVKKRSRGHKISYKHYCDARNHLLAFVEPNISTTSSEPRSIWQILHPYLAAFPDERRLANLALETSAVLMTHVWMGEDSSASFEQLLGGGIGRRVVLSVIHRTTAFLFVIHVRFFAVAWWAKMRDELLQIDQTRDAWIETAGFEDAATFVRKVDEGEPCSDCMQNGLAWLSQLEEDRYYDAWIQHIEDGW